MKISIIMLILYCIAPAARFGWCTGWYALFFCHKEETQWS